MKMNIGIVGATGLVGKRLLSLFNERDTQIEKLKLVASSSNRRSIAFRGRDIPIESITSANFSDLDIVFLSAGSKASKSYAQNIANQGPLVIDNSNAFRMEEDVPLVVPQVNAVELSQRSTRGIISNPNCSTIPIVRVLAALSELAPQQMVVSTYQAVSGAGQSGIDQLRREQEKDSNLPASMFSHQIANNLIPLIDEVQASGETVEELKMRQETRKILANKNIKVSTSCVRVPVFNCHGASVCIDFENDLNISKIHTLIKTAEDIVVHENFPTPIEVDGSDLVHVGRIRIDPESPNRLLFWVVSDNTRVGAALNAVQIMERYTEFHSTQSVARCVA